MAETITTRFELRQWGAGTDTPGRTEFNTSFLNIETLAGIDKQGTAATRLGLGNVIGTYFHETDTGRLWRNTGSAWNSVGSRTVDAIADASATNTVPFSARGPAGHATDLFRAVVDASTVASIGNDGSYTAATGVVGVNRLSAINTAPASVVIGGKGAALQSADLVSIIASDNSNRFKVSAAGAISSPYALTGDGVAVLGAGTSSNVANMNLFSGTPAGEFFAKTGGAGAFNDFLYLRHQAADITAGTRRLGFLMKIGDETVQDAARSGAIYIESVAASANTPDLVLARSDAVAMRFSPSVATIFTGLTANGTVTVTPGSASTVVSANTNEGVQGSGNSRYARVAASGTHYWYSGGSHNDGAGNAGGGTTVGSADNTGLWTMPRQNVTSTNAATLVQASPAWMIGASGGQNLIADRSGIQARNAGAGATLAINGAGGNVDIGTGSAIVNIASGVFRIGGRRLTISDNAPSSPSIGDVWIDT